MAQRTAAGDPARTTESKFYLPAQPTRSPGVGRVERLWTTLFDQRVDPPN